MLNGLQVEGLYLATFQLVTCKLDRVRKGLFHASKIKET